MLNDYPDILTVEQLSEILGIGINAAYRLVNDGTIGCRRIGKTIRIPMNIVKTVFQMKL